MTYVRPSNITRRRVYTVVTRNSCRSQTTFEPYYTSICKQRARETDVNIFDRSRCKFLLSAERVAFSECKKFGFDFSFAYK